MTRITKTESLDSRLAWQFDPTILVLLLLLMSVFFLHGAALDAWWRWDDPTHLTFVRTHDLAEYLFDPTVWQQLSPVNFTPWLSFSYELDSALFGLRPEAHYAHQLISLWLAAALTFFVLKLWLPPWWSFLGALLFLLGSPVYVIAEQLMARHYVEGLVFALAATWFFIRGTRNSMIVFSLVGAFFYFLALISKEIYAPLILLFPIIASGSLALRARHLLPFVFVLLIYIPWRFYMLEMSIGGYSPIATLDPLLTLNELASIPSLLLGAGWLGLASGTSLAIFIIYFLRKYPKRVLVLIWLLFLILAPLIPLTIWPGLGGQDRFLFLPWWMTSFATVWAGAHLTQPGLAHPLRIVAALALFLLVSVAATSQASLIKHSLESVHIEKEVQGRFLWTAGHENVVYLSPAVASMFWDYGKILELRSLARNGEPIPMVIADESQIPNLSGSAIVPWSYDETCQCMIDISDQLELRLKSWKEKVRDVPITVNVTHKAHTFSWELGPYIQGQYSVIAVELGKIPLPAPQGYHRSSIQFREARIRYDSPDGWSAYSPSFQIIPDGTLSPKK